jgi:hypothetical protein
MPRACLTALACLLLVGGIIRAQVPSAPGEPQGTFLGILFGPVPEALYDQVPTLPRRQGVLVTHVLPDSPADQAHLRRHDIVLEYAGQKVRDCEHLTRLIQNDMPEHRIRMLFLRAGKEATTDVTLGRGPALKLAPAQRAQTANEAVPRSVAKGNGPVPVSVSATPLENDRMRVTVEYYQENTGRLRSLTCEGAAAEIDSEIQRLPERERALARVALQRIRALNSPKKQPHR